MNLRVQFCKLLNEKFSSIFLIFPDFQLFQSFSAPSDSSCFRFRFWWEMSKVLEGLASSPKIMFPYRERAANLGLQNLAFHSLLRVLPSFSNQTNCTLVSLRLNGNKNIVSWIYLACAASRAFLTIKASIYTWYSHALTKHFKDLTLF